MNIRGSLKKISMVRYIYFRTLFIKNYFVSSLKKLWMRFGNADQVKLLKTLRSEIKNFYPEHLNLSNSNQISSGKNILGYPALASILLDGSAIGWGFGRINFQNLELPFLQVKTDLEKNIPGVFEKYKPEIILDFGTASGGSAVFFYQLASKYCQPRILSVDISDTDFKQASKFHQAFGSEEKVKFLFKDSLQCLQEVKNFLQLRKPGQKVLISFDDLHTYEHTLKELELYGPLLQTGDVIVMQDTWDQGLFGHEASPMLAVHKFLQDHSEFLLDQDLLKKVNLPCNFIHGVIYRK